MSKIARIETREEMFAKFKRAYPPEFIGKDDELNFAAFTIALDHVALAELVDEALQLPIEPLDGVDVPPAVEFLLAKCWTTESKAA